MMDPLGALLIVGDNAESFRNLEGILKDLSVETWTIKTCDSAESWTAQHKPLLAFIASPVWDSSYPQLVALANKPDLAMNIIVVGTVADIEVYVSSIKRGAFSFIAPPFDHDGVNIIVHSAAMDALERRETMTRALIAQ